jgi:transcriptional regulator with XRE-family HTH domain
MSTADQVLSDFIDAWNAGRRPDVLAYLARLPEGPERDALADEISMWLEVAPTPRYDEAARAAIRAEPALQAALPSLLARLRTRAGLSVGDVAHRIVERFSLGDGDEARAAAYVARLERGDLEPARVSRRLLDALGGLLGAPLAEAVPPRAAAVAGGALFRADGPAGDDVLHELDVLTRAATTPAPAPMDELDRLFTGGPDA